MISLTYALINIILVIVILFGCIWIYGQYRYRYWRNKNLPYIKPKFPTGTFDFGKERHAALFMNDDYSQHKSTLKCIGGYIMFSPTVLILDVDLAKRILGADFNHFQNRGAYVNKRDDPLSGHLFNLEGDKWKVMRIHCYMTNQTKY